MAERHEDRVGQTNRPEPPLGQLTVRDVLREDAVLAGQPEILVGDDALTVPVRWVHVSDSADVARLLVGGELILTTASAWPTTTLYSRLRPALRVSVTCIVPASV